MVAIDLAQHMLDLGRENVARAGLADRILLERVDAKGTPYEDGAFGATISNSIIHHIPEPARCLAEMWRVTAKGGLLFVRDLHRPDGDTEVDRLVALYGGEPPADPAKRRFVREPASALPRVALRGAHRARRWRRWSRRSECLRRP